MQNEFKREILAVKMSSVYNAAASGNVEAVKALVCLGAEVNYSDKDGRTLMLVAAENGHIEVVRALVELGADINRTDKKGCSPLRFAVRNNHSALEKVMRGLDS